MKNLKKYIPVTIKKYGKISVDLPRFFVEEIRAIFVYLQIRKKLKGKSPKHVDKQKIIVSFASYGERLKTILPTIESLVTQTQKPDMIILWLDPSEVIPESLKKYEKYEYFCIQRKPNFGPHAKLFYALQEYSDDIIITVDDDIVYPKKTIEELYHAHLRYPTIIHCHRARKIRYTLKNKLKPYKKWPNFYGLVKGPRFDISPLGGRGTLYPPHVLPKEATKQEKLLQLCPKADDLWWKTMEELNNIPVRQTHFRYRDIQTTPHSQKTALSNENLRKNYNDVQIKKLIEHYKLKDFGKNKICKSP